MTSRSERMMMLADLNRPEHERPAAWTRQTNSRTPRMRRRRNQPNAWAELLIATAAIGAAILLIHYMNVDKAVYYAHTVWL